MEKIYIMVYHYVRFYEPDYEETEVVGVALTEEARDEFLKRNDIFNPWDNSKQYYTSEEVNVVDSLGMLKVLRRARIALQTQT